MATDATGTPSTNFSLPKYNVNVDAPSGLGFNAFVDDLDSKLNSQFVHSADTQATNEVPVWNGSAWIYQKVVNANIDSAAAIAGSKLGFNSGSTPPGSPSDGDLWLYNAALSLHTGTFKVSWLFVYDSSETTYKWRFIGGAPAQAEVAVSESTASTSFTALATAGPSITTTRDGDYLVELGAITNNDTPPAQDAMSYAIGGTAASTADMGWVQQAEAATGWRSLYRAKVKTGLTASALVSKYKVSQGTGLFDLRFLRITPIRVI